MKVRSLHTLASTTALCAVVVASSCVSLQPAAPATPETALPESSDLDGMMSELVAAHNRSRAKAGLSELVVNPRLEAAAQHHARDMAERRRMSHRGSNGSSPFQRMSAQGYTFRRAGENVAAGQRTVEQVMRDWLHSPGHRRNILGKFTEMGASGATDRSGTPYWCVTFGEPTGPDPAPFYVPVGYP